ncbi:hypothetical protein [Shinella sedimenti]|uniref:DUF2059 domain-containing protein n=1 Tax=Shinella sedimenti TaxID=2919913 RepID=A0ABT0CT30_9HYPH|nr:hypothetical protein [Shinella sedimenti]MCJ8151755.1 hypothetical protein [Shinella sedimenti]
MSQHYEAIKRLAAHAVLVAMTLLVGPAALAESDGDKVFELSGLASSFAGAPETASEVARQLGADESVMTAWETAANDELSPARLTQAFRLEFSKEIAPTAIPEILAFRTSELGLKVTAAEVVVARGDERDKRYRAAASEIATLSENRRRLYRELATLTTPRDVNGNLLLLVEALLVPVLPKTSVEAALSQLKNRLRESRLSERVLETTAARYGTLSDIELSLLIEHFRTEEGSAFLVAKSTGEGRVFRRAVRKLAINFAKFVQDR